MTRKQIPLRLPEALVARIDAWAEAEKIGSRNAAIERALDLVLPVRLGPDDKIVGLGAFGDDHQPTNWQPTSVGLPAKPTPLPPGPRNWDGSPVERKPYQKGGKK